MAGWLGGREHGKHKDRQDEIDREWAKRGYGNDGHRGRRDERRRDWRD